MTGVTHGLPTRRGFESPLNSKAPLTRGFRADDGILPAPPVPACGQGTLAEVSARPGGKLFAYSQLAHSSWVRIPLEQ